MEQITTLSQALDISDDCRVVTLADPPYAILHTNRAWSRLTGFKFTEIANRSNHFLQGPHTERDALEQLRDAVRAGKHTKVRIVNYTKSGEPFYNTLECFPLSDRQGNVTHYCGVLDGEPCSDPAIPKVDRTLDPVLLAPKLESMDDKAEASEGEAVAVHRPKRLRRHMTMSEALSNTTDAIVMTQAHPPHKITHVNQPWCEMCGYTLEEVEGLTNSILQGPETDQALLNDLMSSVRRGESSSATLVNYKKGGVKFVNQVQVMPVYNEADELDSFMAMLHDVDNV